jgi:hypothetical protein
VGQLGLLGRIGLLGWMVHCLEYNLHKLILSGYELSI